MDLPFPFGGSPCRMQARPGSQSLSKPFSPSSELLHGGILETQGQLSQSEFSPFPTAVEILRERFGIWVYHGDVFSPARAIPSC